MSPNKTHPYNKLKLNFTLMMSEAATVGVLYEKGDLKFRKFHRKTPVLEFLFQFPSAEQY